MRSQVNVARNERGVAMIVAMLILFVIGVLAAMLTMSSVTHSRLSGVEQRRAKALDLAEAGISEAVSRIKSGEVPGAGLADNPRMVAQIYTVAAGSVPALGADSTGLATAQPAGQWLNYSLPARGGDVLTVRYKTDAARTVIYKYDPNKNPPVQTVSGYNIYEITSVGRVGGTVRRVMTDVVNTPMNLNMKGALACNIDVKFLGNAFSCGFNHRADTPYDTGVNGRAGAGGCNENPGLLHWETGTGNYTGIWSTSTINSGGASSDAGSPTGEMANQTGFYAGPWEALGMTQAQFLAWVGARQASVPAGFNGIAYLDNDATIQNQSGSFSITSDGSGFLYCDGDLTLNAGANWRGLIYVEGDAKINGHSWILGGLIVRGKAQVKFNGGATILYSEDSIKQKLAAYGGSIANLSWREVDNGP